MKNKIVSFIKSNFVPLLIIIIYILVSYIIGGACPFMRILNFPCPACGMSRAYFSLLSLDFAAAFYYHPLFLVMPPMILYLIFGKQPYFRNKKLGNIIIILFFALVFVVYLLRLFVFKDSSIYIDKFLNI